MRISVPVTLLLLMPAVAQPLLSDGDRVVFLGDSITQNGEYPLYLECYLLEQFPTWKISFRNAAWNSDRAWLHMRTGDTNLGGDAMLKMPPGKEQEELRFRIVAHGLARDVLPLKPSVIFIMFGANDVRDGEQAMDLHVRSLQQIITQLRDANCRVILLGAAPEDSGSTFNRAHAQWGAAVRALAEKEKVTFIDVYHAVDALLKETRTADPSFGYTRDGLHPQPAGHALIARAIIAGLRMDPAKLDTASPLLPKVTEKHKTYFHRWREIQIAAMVDRRIDSPEVQDKLAEADRRIAQLEAEIDQFRNKEAQ